MLCKLLLLILISIQLCLVGCVTSRSVAKTESEKTWDQMNSCAEEARKNPIRAGCDERFKDTAIEATVRKISLNFIDIDLDLTVSESDYGARHLVCGLDGKKYRQAVSSLSPGDTVKVQGTMSNLYNSVYFTTISLRPCDIVSSESGH